MDYAAQQKPLGRSIISYDQNGVNRLNSDLFDELVRHNIKYAEELIEIISKSAIAKQSKLKMLQKRLGQLNDESYKLREQIQELLATKSPD